jgi:lipid-A-disaccharide synthase
VLIDYPGFNLRLAKALRKCGYRGKIVHYISPTVWAWRKGRINTMADNLDLLLTIYPFEAECYAQTSLPVEFVGHPLTERLHSYSYNEEWQRLLKIPDDGPLVALFPGSRVAEVARNLPLQLQAAEQLAARRGKRIFGLSCGNAEVAAEVERVLSEVGSPLKIGRELFLVPTEFSYELMRDAHCAIAKSGTVTLELALHHCPSVVVYNLSAFNRFIAKRIFRLSLANYCIVNILAEERVFPELIEHGCSAHNAAQWLEELDAPSAARNRALAGCKRIAELLAISNGSQRAAQAIVEQIR